MTSPGAATSFPGGAERSCVTWCEDDEPAGRPVPDGDGGLASLPPGLLCQDLAALGLGPADAAAYWFYWAQPDRMDADLDGVPCETVWPEMDRYVGVGDGDWLASLPPGLLCQDLAALGLGPADAAAYWFYWAQPDRMDADLDGVPCETVWPDMERYVLG
ncbi:hypothetical protein [Blastococcus sp. SYSU D00695]